MQSQGSTSSQPSFDSLSSSDSLLFSDSEQAEDDTDVFLTDGSSSVIIGSAGGATATEDRGSESPGSQWMCGGYTDKEEEEESYRSEESGRQGGSHQLGRDGSHRPDPEITGRLAVCSKGLSSFQQSVAMDRIQRIVGVLQRPNSGEKVPEHSAPGGDDAEALVSSDPCSACLRSLQRHRIPPLVSLRDTSSSTPPHKHRDQLQHFPSRLRTHQQHDDRPPVPKIEISIFTSKLLSCSFCRSADSAGQACPSHEGTSVAGNNENQPIAAVLPPGRRGSPATQDSSISSSTTPYKHPKNPKKPIRCQSQPVAGQQSEDRDHRDLSGLKSNLLMSPLKPLPRVCPTPLET
ncbi:hypothetical protein GBF38_004877 [Nibea albiflora]|uniref:Uncharacterized protein n=1 Tax=Nibea albiflora TaxID=240163 RepID=A0ACB7F6D2_NIBAL|nr:hypothetical protein GBF38_004877 [Nibea albiflora]